MMMSMINGGPKWRKHHHNSKSKGLREVPKANRILRRKLNKDKKKTLIALALLKKGGEWRQEEVGPGLCCGALKRA